MQDEVNFDPTDALKQYTVKALELFQNNAIAIDFELQFIRCPKLQTKNLNLYYDYFPIFAISMIL